MRARLAVRCVHPKEQVGFPWDTHAALPASGPSDVPELGFGIAVPGEPVFGLAVVCGEMDRPQRSRGRLMTTTDPGTGCSHTVRHTEAIQQVLEDCRAM